MNTTDNNFQKAPKPTRNPVENTLDTVALWVLILGIIGAVSMVVVAVNRMNIEIGVAAIVVMLFAVVVWALLRVVCSISGTLRRIENELRKK